MKSKSRKISFITAAFRQPIRLKRAVRSLLEQTNPNWEMVISPDDGENYDQFARYDHRIRIVSTEASHTGAGRARNRGSAIASGDYIAVLDDDDRVARNFVHETLQALESAHTVTVPTAYIREEGNLIREVGKDYPEIDIPRFSRELGSMHVVSERRLHQPWQDCFAEDVLHTCVAISNAGGKIPVVRTTRYVGIVRQDSTCTTKKDIESEYEKLIDLGFLSPAPRAAIEIRQLFEHRQKINSAFEARKIKADGYHEFVSSLQTSSETISSDTARSCPPCARKIPSHTVP